MDMGTVGCVMLLGIAGFIGFLFYRRKRIFNDIGDFYKENGHIYRETSPVKDPFVYSDAALTCTDATLKEGMPYTLMLGSRTAHSGGSASLYTYIGMYIPNHPALSDDWLKQWKQKVAERGDNWAQHSGVEKAEKSWGLMGAPEELPIVAKRVEGGVLLSWSGLHIRKVIEARIQAVRDSLQGA